MRKLFPMLTVAALFAGLTFVVRADEPNKEIKGEGQCAKCSLKEKTSDGESKCQNVIVVTDAGKKTTYYLKDKEGSTVSQKFHKNLCQEKKTVKAKGDLTEKDGKKVLMVSSIEVVED